MKIGICSDHAGFAYKSRLIGYLESKGYEVEDFGTHSEESMDYPDVAHPLAEAVEKGETDLGIALCGTGNGNKGRIGLERRNRQTCQAAQQRQHPGDARPLHPV